MTKLRTIIVDDERLARINLKKLIEPYTELEIVGEADSNKNAIEIIRLFKPHLIFLDIQLAGETGFDLLERIDNTIKIVFVTAFDNYAIKAFEVNATDYLLKPINPDRLKTAINRIIRGDFEIKNKTKTLDYSDSVYVRLSNSTSKFIKVNSITVISPVGNYSKIVSNDGKHYLVLKTLKQWEDELPTNNFIRIHRSSIVNIEHVERLEKHSISHNKLFLRHSNEPLDVSRRYASKLKAIN